MRFERHSGRACRPEIGAVVLAAGQSRRMGEQNKLLTPWLGSTLVEHVVDEAMASDAQTVCVVTGHEGDRVASLLTDRPVVIVRNPEYAEGMASSLRSGVRVLPQSTDGILVCLGDMPLVQAGHLDRLIAAFSQQDSRGICIPTYTGRRGNPVLLSVEFRREIACLEGDRGARGLITARPEVITEVPVDDPSVLIDIDTPASLQSIQLAYGNPDT